MPKLRKVHVLSNTDGESSEERGTHEFAVDKAQSNASLNADVDTENQPPEDWVMEFRQQYGIEEETELAIEAKLAEIVS